MSPRAGENGFFDACWVRRFFRRSKFFQRACVEGVDDGSRRGVHGVAQFMVCHPKARAAKNIVAIRPDVDVADARIERGRTGQNIRNQVCIRRGQLARFAAIRSTSV